MAELWHLVARSGRKKRFGNYVKLKNKIKFKKNTKKKKKNI